MSVPVRPSILALLVLLVLLLASPLPESIHKEFGVGPRAMPLLAGGKLFTVGITGLLQCFDPETGKVHWNIHHENQWGTNCTTPVLGPECELFVTTEEAGSRLLRLQKEGDAVVAKEAWFERRPQVVFTNVILVGKTLIGTRLYARDRKTIVAIEIGKDRS